MLNTNFDNTILEREKEQYEHVIISCRRWWRSLHLHEIHKKR